MSAVLSCIQEDHNLWLVFLAGVLCLTGSFSVFMFLARGQMARGRQRSGWHFLTALAAGATIWCTHFIAMLGYQPGAGVTIDPGMTAISLVIAIMGSAIGFWVAFLPGNIVLRSIGGGLIVGTAISTMHYVGMSAYRVQGLVTWDMNYVMASVALSVLLSAVSLYAALKTAGPIKVLRAPLLFTVAVCSLHFTGMAALTIEPLRLENPMINQHMMTTLAYSVAAVCLIVLAAGVASYLIDGSMREETSEQLAHMVLHDPLTGLPNRVGVNEYLDRELQITQVNRGTFALVVFDINRFRDINDHYGFHVGDAILKALARRLESFIQVGGFVAHLGGNEFCIVYRYPNDNELNHFLASLERKFEEPVEVEGARIRLEASLGVALYPDNAIDRSNLFNRANLALRRAKSDVTISMCFYEERMDESVRERRALSIALREAISNGELEVHYQPQASVADLQIRSFEALMRWNHPELGYVSPVKFIPVAESNGLIVPLGAWILRETCRQIVSWSPKYKVAVNVSPIQLSSEGFPELVAEVLRDTGLDPQYLELELTESAIIADEERTLAILNELKGLGVSIALDDFGTGYSSMETLRRFPFDKIKLDRSFIVEAESSRQSRAIISAIMTLGDSLGIPILAEGIETHGQLEFLREEGCEKIQGYFVGRPMPLEDMIRSGQVSVGDSALYREKTWAEKVQEPPAASFSEGKASTA